MFASETFSAGRHPQPTRKYPISIISLEQSVRNTKLKRQRSSLESFLLGQMLDIGAIQFSSEILGVKRMILRNCVYIVGNKNLVQQNFRSHLLYNIKYGYTFPNC